MKSLEIVNKKINYCEEQEVPCVSMRLVSLQQIKQDLEVLEMIKNNLIFNSTTSDVDYGEYEIGSFELFLDKDVHKEAYNKLKQWLEENEE